MAHACARIAFAVRHLNCYNAAGCPSPESAADFPLTTGPDTLKLVAGNSNRVLAEAIANYLEIPLAKCLVRRFADQEIFVEIQENVRGQDMFVVQSTSFPANDHLMELLIITDALRRSSARRITAVIPYFGYARQDRRSGSRTPISAKLVANLITVAGADRVLCVDLHAGQIQGFLDLPVDHLEGTSIFVPYIKSLNLKNLLIASPDVGGAARAPSSTWWARAARSPALRTWPAARPTRR